MKGGTVIAFGVLALILSGCSIQQSDGDTFPTPQIGQTAAFQEYPHWNVSGIVAYIDAATLRFEDFSFHGDGLRTEIRLMRNRDTLATIATITDKVYDHSTFDLAIPTSAAAFNLIAVYSPDLGAVVSGAAFR